MKMYLKNMVCDRCTLVVGQLLDGLGFDYVTIKLGEVDFGELQGDQLNQRQIKSLSTALTPLGFAILSDKKSQLIAAIKRQCLEYLNNLDGSPTPLLSEYLSQALHKENKDYKQFSPLFSQVEGITIEQYFIRLRIEKVKELLIYGELSLSEIAFRLNFSSTAHLSGQFKKTTGLTAGHFRSLNHRHLRLGLDEL